MIILHMFLLFYNKIFIAANEDSIHFIAVHVCSFSTFLEIKWSEFWIHNETIAAASDTLS